MTLLEYLNKNPKSVVQKMVGIKNATGVKAYALEKWFNADKGCVWLSTLEPSKLLTKAYTVEENAASDTNFVNNYANVDVVTLNQ